MIAVNLADLRGGLHGEGVGGNSLGDVDDCRGNLLHVTKRRKLTLHLLIVAGICIHLRCIEHSWVAPNRPPRGDPASSVD